MKKRNLGEGVFQICNGLVLLIVSLVTLYPFLYVIFASFSDPLKLMGNSSLLLKPLGFSLGAYKKVFLNPSIYSGYMNTVFYVTVGTLVNILATCMAAYVLSRKQFMLRRVLTIMFIFTMYFSGGLIPTYMLVNSLGLVNTRWSMIIPSAMSTYNMIICRTYFVNSIPDELYEAGQLDGCTPFKYLLRVVVPLSKPILAVLVLYYGVTKWNSYFDAMIYLKSQTMVPLQIVLRDILILNQVDYTMISDASAIAAQRGLTDLLKYSTIVVASLPVLCIYPFVQKYFVKGVMIGAVKG